MTSPVVTRGRGLRLDAMRNHERILAAAGAAFEHVGPAASLEEVARRAGVGVATVYRRFRTRDQLVQAVFEHVFTTEIEPPTQVETNDPWSDLAAVLETTVVALAAHRVVLALAHEVGAIDVDTIDHYLGRLDRLVSRARDAGMVRRELEPRDVAAALVMTLATMRRGPDRRDDGTWRRYLALLLDGMRPAPTPLPARTTS